MSCQELPDKQIIQHQELQLVLEGPFCVSASPYLMALLTASSTAEQIRMGLEAAKQSTSVTGDEPAASSGVSAEASRSAEHEEEHTKLA